MQLEEARSPHSPAPSKVFHHSIFAMNTRFSMVLVGVDGEQAEALGGDAERDLCACERLLSRFDAESPVSDLNRRAAEEDVEPPAELSRILALCGDYWRRTGGAFDITLWPLNRLWREQMGRGEEPAEAAIQQALEQTGFHRLHFDETAQTLRFERWGMSLDLGGFGKGYALERLAGTLRAAGVERAFLSFGESSVTVLGSHPHGPAWPVGVSSLFPPHEPVHTFALRDASLSTSGTAPFNAVGGPRIMKRILGQIIHPRSGRPIEGYRTLSVASPSGIEAEVLSTALLITPERERAGLLSGFPAVSAVEIVYDSNAGQFAPRIEWKYGF
jgi:thiamine biosynthesis lipoprotein